MRADPGREDLLGQRSVSGPDNDSDILSLGCLEFETVESEESAEGDESGRLVSIDEGVALRDSLSA